MCPKKILIISKPRCGSTTFSVQLSRLLQYKLYIEPQIDVYPSLLKDENLVVKIVFSGTNNSNSTKDLVFSINWDLVIVIRRDENDSKLSFANASKTNQWHEPYIIDTKIPVTDYIHSYYKEADLYLEEFRQKFNCINVEYENLYNENEEVRKLELNKLINLDKVHWLVKKNALNSMSPENRYGKLQSKHII